MSNSTKELYTHTHTHTRQKEPCPVLLSPLSTPHLPRSWALGPVTCQGLACFSGSHLCRHMGSAFPPIPLSILLLPKRHPRLCCRHFCPSLSLNISRSFFSFSFQEGEEMKIRIKSMQCLYFIFFLITPFPVSSIFLNV